MVGNLADLGLGDIFQIVSLSRRSGTLQLTTSLDSGEIIFEQGLVVAGYRTGAVLTVGEGLMEAGIVTPTDYQDMLIAQRDGLRGEALLERFSLCNEDTQKALSELLQADVYKMLAWDEGGFSFVLEATPDRWRGFSLDATRVVVLDGLSPQYLAMEGARIRDENAEPDALEEFLARSARVAAPPKPPPRPITDTREAVSFARGLGATDALAQVSAGMQAPEPSQETEPAAEELEEQASGSSEAPAPSEPENTGAQQGATPPGLVPPPASITHDPAAHVESPSTSAPPTSPGGVVPPPASIINDPAARRETATLSGAGAPAGGVVPPPASITNDPAAQGVVRPQKDKVIPFPADRVRRGADGAGAGEHDEQPGSAPAAEPGAARGSGGGPASAPARQPAPDATPSPGPQAEVEVEPQAPSEAALRPAAQTEPGSGRILLVVDDDPDLGPLIGQTFASNYSEMVSVTSVQEARRLLQSHAPYLVLAVDLILPRSDGQGILGGLEILEEARALNPNLQAVMFTDYHNVEAQQQARELGVLSVLVKPRRAQMFEPGTSTPSAQMWSFLEELGTSLESTFATGTVPPWPEAEAQATGGDAGAESTSAIASPGHAPSAVKTGRVGTEIYDLAQEIAREFGDEEADPNLPPPNRSDGALAELRTMLAELADPANRETITLLVLRFAADVVDRAALLLNARTHFIGLGGFSGPEPSDDYVRRVRRVRIPTGEDSAFATVAKYRTTLRGPLQDTPANRAFLAGLSGTGESGWHQHDSIVVPLVSANRVAAILYGDNPGGEALGKTDALEIFMQQAGLTMDRVLLERQLEQSRKKGDA